MAYAGKMSNYPHIPQGYHSVTPSLTCKDTAAALDFYKAAFNAVEHFRMPDEKTGKIMHAEFSIGNSIMMISSEYAEYGAFAPEIGTGGSFMIYVPDANAAYAQALAAGATSIMEPTDHFWGDRSGRVADPHGYRWGLAQKVRDVSPEEMQAGMKAWGEEQA